VPLVTFLELLAAIACAQQAAQGGRDGRGVVMTERTPEERQALNEDESEVEVEGHRFYGPEDPAEAERRPRLNEDDTDGDEEGRINY